MRWGKAVIGALEVIRGDDTGNHQAIRAQDSEHRRGMLFVAWSAKGKKCLPFPTSTALKGWSESGPCRKVPRTQAPTHYLKYVVSSAGLSQGLGLRFYVYPFHSFL